MTKYNVETSVSNLYLKGVGNDKNGNWRIVVGFPNDRGFSIQTNGVLKNTNNITRKNEKLDKLSDNELKIIGKEVTDYVKKYGSSNVKNRLKIYGESKMSKKKKKLNEGAVMLTSLLPVATYSNLRLSNHGPDNFEFKGLPGQFDENGNKFLDEHGNKINESTFTKKHYIAIAKVLKSSKTVAEVAKKLANLFEHDNPAFKKELFLNAAKYKTFVWYD